jgi:hypothetical protein
MVYVSKNKISDFPIFDTSTFEQIEGESLKDAWYRIKAMHTTKTSPCCKARLFKNFYFVLLVSVRDLRVGVLPGRAVVVVAVHGRP